jgi:hypothetical protein
MDPQAIVDALTGSQPQLERLAGAISTDNGSARALLGPLIDPIAVSIAADANLSQAIVDAAHPAMAPGAMALGAPGAMALGAPGAMAPGAMALGAPGAMAQGALVEYIGRDANGPVAKEMTITELFRKDPVLFDQANAILTDLPALLGAFDANMMRQIYMEPGAADVPKIRYAMSKYIEMAGNPGPAPTGRKTTDANMALLDPLDRTNLSRFPTTMNMTFSWSKDDNPWRTPDNFIDFRRLKLKSGYAVTNRNNAVDTHNDVYVYYFNKVGSTTQSNAVLEIPFDTSNFMIPSGWKAYARYPDGIILYKSPAGVMQAQFPIAPTGTYFKASSSAPPSDYMLAAQAAVANEKARIDAMNLSRSETQSMYEFAAYLGIMQEVKDNKRIRGGTNHVTKNRRGHHRNKSVSRKSKMTRTKGRGRARARAMSMLKSAKQRFYGGQQIDNNMVIPGPNLLKY